MIGRFAFCDSCGGQRRFAVHVVEFWWMVEVSFKPNQQIGEVGSKKEELVQGAWLLLPNELPAI